MTSSSSSRLVPAMAASVPIAAGVALGAVGVAAAAGEVIAARSPGVVAAVLGGLIVLFGAARTVRALRGGGRPVRDYAVASDLVRLVVCVAVPLVLGRLAWAADPAVIALAILPLILMAGASNRVEDEGRAAAAAAVGGAVALVVVVLVADPTRLPWSVMQGAVVSLALVAVGAGLIALTQRILLSGRD